MPTRSETRSPRRRTAAILLGVALIATGAASRPSPAAASTSQISIIQDNSDLYNASGALTTFRSLGANAVRVIVHWSRVAPQPKSFKTPHFNATDPNAYPAANWAPIDAIVRAAQANGMLVDMTVSGGAPYWGDGPGIPAQAKDPEFSWRPNPKEYGQFVTAVGRRYSGSFTPRAQASAVPRVHFWAIYNEPNFGEDLGPQAINGSTVSVAPMMYRGLVDNAWRALQATGHGHDTILIGEFAARGLQGRASRGVPQGFPGNFSQTKPLQFIKTLYCLDSFFHPLRGSYAAARGCPTTAAGSRRFRSQHPGLFSASAISDHPYPDNLSPVTDGRGDPDFAAFPELGNFAHTFDRALSVYGSHKRYPIYNTEYGYITHPPDTSHYVSQAQAAIYINWAEYLSYKNPRLKSYMQYLLTDPPASAGAFVGFASGLETANGTPKASYYAYRMPVFMPRTSFSHSTRAEVWGAARPARFEARPQTVQIQLSQRGHFSTVATARLSSSGYFDTRVKFPAGGTVRLAWRYPQDPLLYPLGVDGETIYSRSVAISVH